jgi:MFS family permease
MGNALSVERDKLPLGAVMSRALRAIPGMFVASLLLGLMIGAVVLAGAIVVGILTPIAGDSDVISLLVMIAAVVAYFAALIIIVLLSMTMAGAAFDGAGMGTLGRAWRLVRRNKLNLVAYMILIGLLVFGVMFGLVITMVILSQLGDAGAMLGVVLYFVVVALMPLMSISANAAAYLTLVEIEDGPAQLDAAPQTL